MPSVTLEQKRLETLRKQLYGKDPGTKKASSYSYSNEKHHTVASNTTSSITTETTYLKQDLIKIAFLSGVALAIQVLLYVGLKMNLVPLRF